MLFFRSSGKPINSSDFKYLGKYEPLNLDLFRPGQPNSKTGDDQCIISYFGLEPNVSWYALKLNPVWGWASCSGQSSSSKLSQAPHELQKRIVGGEVDPFK